MSVLLTCAALVLKSGFRGARQLQAMAAVKEESIQALCKKIVPALAEGKHKGQAGRIGVVGGSLEYTGAPYFAGISALKVGADLSHVFCAKAAGPVIKSYSPELIVHPVLDAPDALTLIRPWLDRLHVLVVGPGLGREPSTLETTAKLIDACRELQKPLVIDADGLFLITQRPDLIHNYPAVILTPNVAEFSRLFGGSPSGDAISDAFKSKMETFGRGCVVLRKGQSDLIYGVDRHTYCTTAGSGRRCGGQGDLLSGSLATFYCWALNNSNVESELRPLVACYAACTLIRQCNASGFATHGRSMTASDMIPQIGPIFKKQFEL